MVDERRAYDGGGLNVALGDSISFDDYAGGQQRSGASLPARNRGGDFPSWQQPPRLVRSGVRPSILTLTIGGNDVLGWYGETPGAVRTADAAVDRTDEALDWLPRVADPAARMVVGTVHDPGDGTADTRRVGLPPWQEVVEVIAQLDTGLPRLAGRHGVAVVDIHEKFHSHGLATGNPAHGDTRPPDRDLWYCNIIAPNAWGARPVRESFWEALGRPLPAGRPGGGP